MTRGAKKAVLVATVVAAPVAPNACVPRPGPAAVRAVVQNRLPSAVAAPLTLVPPKLVVVVLRLTAPAAFTRALTRSVVAVVVAATLAVPDGASKPARDRNRPSSDRVRK